MPCSCRLVLVSLQLIGGIALCTNGSIGPDLPAAERQRAGARQLAGGPMLLLFFGHVMLTCDAMSVVSA